MWTKAQGEENTGARRKELLEKGYELFSTKSIESVGMRDVAKAVGCGSTSAYRYYGSKPDFVVAVATWKGSQVKGIEVKTSTVAGLRNLRAKKIKAKYAKYQDGVITITDKDFEGTIKHTF